MTLKLCTTCQYRKHVYTMKNGRDAYCLHPRSVDPADGVAMGVYSARMPGKPCGPDGHLHSDHDSRTGYVSPEQWRTTQ